MRFSLCTVIAATAATVVAQVQDAPVVTSNPIGAQYVAELPNKASTAVRGSVVGKTAPSGKGVQFQVAISGLPAEGGPFIYHIHEKPVPADGNCTLAAAHLDPYKRGETPLCNAKAPQTCQVGDLSGKHGNLTTPGGSFDYLDEYASTNPADKGYFGNLSFVVHFSNKTRITCANFIAIDQGSSSSAIVSSGYALPTGTGIQNGTVLPTGTGAPHGSASATYNSPTLSQASTTATGSGSPSAAPSSGATERLTVAGAGVLVGAVAMLL